MSSIVFHDGITEIGDNAFFDCKSLKEITIPDSVTKIGRDAFIR
ncbi:MAG: leucine-rich repeat protein [bacterium LCO1.1]|uniref:Leucine-rich repeat protein n=1 Tax=Candidatus Weimeria bifida TaxID=2599074 RepID=A0A6N7IZA7_9FIRM|nr:leucine-rich repeat protein [Candidatus Weimeria bifida]